MAFLVWKYDCDLLFMFVIVWFVVKKYVEGMYLMVGYLMSDVVFVF